jgi:hypothetical protein
MKKQRIPFTEQTSRFLDALADLGGKAGFTAIQAKAGLSAASTQRVMLTAVADGLVERSGAPRTPLARIALTHAGRAEVRKRRPNSILTVPLGSSADDQAYETVRVSMSEGEAARAMRNPVVVAGMINGAREAASLRSRIIKALCDEREWGLIGLTQVVRRDHKDQTSPRDVGAVLNSLNQQGLVTFTEGAQEIGHHSLTKIRATKTLLRQEGIDTDARVIGEQKGGTPQHKTDRTDWRTHSPRAEGGPIEHVIAPEDEVVEEDVVVEWPNPSQPMLALPPEPTLDVPSAPEVPEPTQRAFPLLEALRERQSASIGQALRADRYLLAASVLEEEDPEESARLLAKAGEVAGEPLSPLEIEYLDFASRS